MLQHLLKLFLRGVLAVGRNRKRELLRVHLFGLSANARKNGVPILRKQLINKINQQKFGRDVPCNIQSKLEGDHSIAERKCSFDR